MTTEVDSSKVLHQFFSRIPSVKYIFTNGKEAHFINGRFTTDVVGEIEQLNAEIAEGHPHLFTKPEALTITVADLDPLAEIKRKAIEEHMAKLAAASNPENDMGTSEQTKLDVANSVSVKGATAASNSAGVK